MTKRTKTTLLIATTYFVILLCTFIYALYLVRAQGSALDTARAKIAEDTAKDSAYNAIVRIAESSVLDRAELETYFITEKDTIQFIAELEAAAARVGVTFQTTELSTPEPTTTENGETRATLVVGCKFTGDEASVKEFLQVIENIPYHTEIPLFTISNQAQEGKWIGEGKLILTIKP